MSMEPAGFNERVRAAIVTLNNHYGRGTLVEWQLFGDGRIVATFRPYGLRDEVRRGRLLNGRIVRMFGHQKTIKE